MSSVLWLWKTFDENYYILLIIMNFFLYIALYNYELQKIIVEKGEVKVVDGDIFEIKQKHQILHIADWCNECGNCGTFCPHGGRPYKDKITLFWTESDFVDSTNVGFLHLSENQFMVRDEIGKVFNYTIGDKTVSSEIETIINTVVNQYSYLVV